MANAYDYNSNKALIGTKTTEELRADVVTTVLAAQPQLNTDNGFGATFVDTVTLFCKAAIDACAQVINQQSLLQASGNNLDMQGLQSNIVRYLGENSLASINLVFINNTGILINLNAGTTTFTDKNNGNIIWSLQNSLTLTIGSGNINANLVCNKTGAYSLTGTTVNGNLIINVSITNLTLSVTSTPTTTFVGNEIVESDNSYRNRLLLAIQKNTLGNAVNLANAVKDINATSGFGNRTSEVAIVEGGLSGLSIPIDVNQGTEVIPSGTFDILVDSDANSYDIATAIDTSIIIGGGSFNTSSGGLTRVNVNVASGRIITYCLPNIIFGKVVISIPNVYSNVNNIASIKTALLQWQTGNIANISAVKIGQAITNLDIYRVIVSYFQSINTPLVISSVTLSLYTDATLQTPVNNNLPYSWTAIDRFYLSDIGITFSSG